MRTSTIVLLSTLLSCAPARSDVPTTSATQDVALARMQEQIAALEGRVQRLERNADDKSERPASAPPPTTSPGWSCMAKCGKRSTQTTEFHVTYDRVTGDGATAAEAYSAMVGKCKGTIYERIVDERFVGGEMKSVCISNSAPSGGGH